MGKIVKGAQVSGDRYFVSVPQVADPGDETDAPTGDEFGAESFALDESGIAPVAPDQPVIAAPPEPAIDWDALREEAEAIIDSAARDAQALIRQAQESALDVVTQAKVHAVEVENEARTRGHDEGYAAGKAAADAELTEMTATMRELIESARAQRHEIIETAEPELVRLAMAIAERVIHRQIADDPNVVVENVRQALTRLVSREMVTLRVNPADLETIRQHRDSIVTSSDVEHLRIVEDQRVDRGGVVVETDAGTIDAKVATQLREARRAIAADEPIEIAPTHAQAS
jgi:flagellar assembly protein FliH